MQHHDKENQLTLDDTRSPLIHSTTPHSSKHNLFKSSKHSVLSNKPTTSTLMGRPKQMMLHDITNSNCRTPVLRHSSKLSQVTVSIEDLDQSNEIDQTLDELGEIENAHIVDESELDGGNIQWHYDEELRHLVEVAKQSHFYNIEGLEYFEVEKSHLPSMLVDEPDFVTKATGVLLLPF